MREIEFRGKITKERHPNDGIIWVEGDYMYRGSPCIRRRDMNIPYWVYPETVGQYTGLKDKNGVKIFEGDICSDSRGDLFVIRFDEFTAAFMGKYITGDDWKKNGAFRLKNELDIEVVGNIHDNPEFL